MKSPKVARAADCQALAQLPNIGPALAADLCSIGIHYPHDLQDKVAFVLYQCLCAATGQRQDRCVFDTFMDATDFTQGARPPRGGNTRRCARLCLGEFEGKFEIG